MIAQTPVRKCVKDLRGLAARGLGLARPLCLQNRRSIHDDQRKTKAHSTKRGRMGPPVVLRSWLNPPPGFFHLYQYGRDLEHEEHAGQPGVAKVLSDGLLVRRDRVLVRVYRLAVDLAVPRRHDFQVILVHVRAVLRRHLVVVVERVHEAWIVNSERPEEILEPQQH